MRQILSSTWLILLILGFAPVAHADGNIFNQTDASALSAATISTLTATTTFTGQTGYAGFVYWKASNYALDGTLSYAMYLVDSDTATNYLCQGLGPHKSEAYDLIATTTADQQDLAWDCSYANVFAAPWVASSSPFLFDPTHTYEIKVFVNTSGSSHFQYYGKDNGTSDPDPYVIFTYFTAPPEPDLSTKTRIVSFSPDDGATVHGPSVAINEHIYINPDDLAGQLGIRLSLHNIDQNVLLLGAFSPSDIMIFNGEATTSGDVFIGGNYALADGNYRLNATITKTVLYGFLKDPFSKLNDDQSHQFIVGSSTFIGTLTQNGYSEFNGILSSTTATSTAALAKTCNPVTFDIVQCLAFLFIPGGPQLNNTLVTFRDDVLQRAPWGYVSRTYKIMTASTTAALPSFTVAFPIGPPDNLSTTSLTFDPGDMLAGAATLLTNTKDPQNGKNMRDVMEPFVQLTIALAVLFTIFADLTGSHKHHTDQLARRS